MDTPLPDPRKFRRGWPQRFANAFRGLGFAMIDQPSFYVHWAMTAAVVIVAAVLGATRIEWCLLLLCIAVVMTAEAFNSALEWLARAVDQQPNPRVGAALDAASGAVLLSATGAALVGCLVLGYRLAVVLGWLDA